ncbi:MAG: hypothetical protein AB7Q37_16540 [Pyrinomonadaceae bacterium]
MVVAFIVLTAVEIVVLRASKRVDAPKFFWFPVTANIVGGAIVGIVVAAAVILFTVGFVVAFDSGYNAGQKYFYFTLAALLLIPILVFIARTALFLIFKLGKPPAALLYSLLTTIISIAAVGGSAMVFLGIYENFLK